MDASLRQGARVWLREQDQLQPCTVGPCADGNVRFISDYGTVFQYPRASLSREKVLPMHQSSVNGVEDMSMLGDLHEAAILLNLHQRYQQGNIYEMINKVTWFLKHLPHWDEEDEVGLSPFSLCLAPEMAHYCL